MSGGFWSMGGYARYVWPSYVLAFARARMELMGGAPVSFLGARACAPSARNVR